MSSRKKVFVSGCFDMLHSGHIAFLQEAAGYGDLYIGLGSDKTIRELKGRENVRKLAEAADKAWEGLRSRDFEKFSEGFLESFHSQVRMFPGMMNPDIERIIKQYKGMARAWKLSGAGGGGYLIMVSEKEIPNTFRLKVRVKELGI